MTDRITQAAAALTAAFGGPLLTGLDPAAEPQSEGEAYAVQTAVLGGEVVAGWKVAPARDGVIRCAPLGASRWIAEGGVLPPGLQAPLLEVELALRLAADVPAGAGAEQILAAIGMVCLGFEILGSRFVVRKAVSPLAALADAQSNRAFSAASTGVPWAAVEMTAVPLTLFCDGQVVSETPGGASSAQVAGAVIWLASHASARGLLLRRGEVIITGSRLGPMPIPAGRQLVAKGGGVGEARLILNNEHTAKEVKP
ncbi:2-keto-4-pentenoate hydratase [Paracoccaceae bacterium]